MKYHDSGDIFARFFSSSASILIAESISLPFDVIKTRLQVQNNSNGLWNCLFKIARNEGTSALWKGWTPATIRAVSYGSFCLVFYEPMRNFISSKTPLNDYLTCLLAGGSAGALAISIFNPTEVIKTQLQIQKSQSETIKSLTLKIWKTRGILGFWSGLRPNIARTFAVNASELGTYDWTKGQLSYYMSDGPLCHISSSVIAAVASTATSTPFDVIKTRMMSRAEEKLSLMRLITEMYKKEGIGVFYKGSGAIFSRKVIWCVLFFMSYEKFRPMLSKSIEK